MKKILLICLLLSSVSLIAQQACPDKINISYSGSAGGTVVCNKISATCADHKITAVPADGYEFLYWLDGVTENPRTWNFNFQNADFGAVFAKKADIHSAAGNTIVTIANAATPSFTFTAENGSCATFSKWDNNISTPSIAYTSADGVRRAEYNYTEVLYQQEDQNVQAGTIEVTPLTCGFTLRAVANTDYKFTQWRTGETSAVLNVDYAVGDYEAIFTKGVASGANNDVFTSISDALESNDTINLLSDNEEDIVISKPVVINGNGVTIGDLTIANGGELTLTGALTVQNLYLNTNSEESAQLHNASNLTYQNAYVDVRLEPVLNVADPKKWYAFAVPFNVDVQTGVRRQSAPTKALTNTKDYLIWEYDGELRATNKQNGWVKMQNGTTLTPGNFYMIGIDGNENVWRFTKSDGTLEAASHTLPISKYDSDVPNRGWNALANSQLAYATASVDGINYGQVYDNASASGVYHVVNFSTTTFAMCQPFFVQAKANGSLTLTAVADATLAPRRMVEDNNNVFMEVLLRQNNRTVDNLYLTAHTDATDSYEIGKDVIKMTGGSADSYIWADGYGYKLCAQDLPLTDNVEYNITLYASKAGEYSLRANMGQLYDSGIMIWDFSMGDYDVELVKGRNSDYSIRVSAPRNTPTDLDHMQQRETIRKCIIDGNLMIINGQKMYNATGQKVF